MPTWAIILVLVIGTVLGVLCVLAYLVDREMNQVFRMTNQTYQETVSPDGKYVATLAYRDGLTFGFEYLSLQPRSGWRHLRTDDPIPDDEVAEMADEGIDSVVWLNAHTLVVKYEPGMRADCFVKRSQSWRDVRLTWHEEKPR
jgi:hypothetical protein